MRRMKQREMRSRALTMVLVMFAGTVAIAPPASAETQIELRLPEANLPGLEGPARVRRDANDIPHIFALSEADGQFMLGYVHAQDRFFQMDTLRRTFSGTSAELFGDSALPQDVQLRTLGLRRAAEASLAAVSDEVRTWLDAYAAGVNAWLGSTAALPPEYAALEITQVQAWNPIDSLAVVKGLAFGLSFDLGDIDFTQALLTFQGVGAVAGFDGMALFSEDLYRTAPFDPSISIPFAQPSSAETDGPSTPAKRADYLDESTLALIRDFKAKASEVPLLKEAIDRRNTPKGSNWWVVGGEHTDSGYPVLANDPHLALNAPSTFYESHVRMRSDDGIPINVSGISFAGAPGIVLGCNPWICWGATVHPMDVTDVYQEQLVVDPNSGLPVGTVYQGNTEPLVLIPQTFMVNVVGDTVADNLVDAGIGPLDGGVTLVVPRRNNGPIVQVDFSNPLAPTALSVQYTGWGPTTELDAFRGFGMARNIDQFADAVQSFDVGSQNFGYADIDGNIAYFTSAEMPLREDLQTLHVPDGGIPPYFIRDGTGSLMHEWMPLSNPQPDQNLGFEILPYAEMPQLRNPSAGYILNANNDPVGTSLDNNPLNQVRPGGGLYYLSPGYASGFRMGRLQRLFDGTVGQGEDLTVDEVAAFQGNNQLLDAEALVPYLVAAAVNAALPDAPAELAALGADAEIAEAIARLAAWDFSSPTGLAEGWDPGDDPAGLTAPTQDEIDASVAATIYSAWRGQAVQRVIDAPLDALGVGGFSPGSSLSMTALRNLLDNFGANQGVGASGIDFFQLVPVPGTSQPPPVRRDLALLGALRDALDLLASDTFADAYGNSKNQDDYRWGYLHRIVFDHPLGGPFNLPPAGGPDNLSPELAGFARAGGFGALDASSHSSRADGINEFMFGSGPARRFVGEMTPAGPDSRQVTPGGVSGVVGSPYQADQLPLWLSNSYHPMRLTPQSVLQGSRTFQRFVPVPAGDG
nr:penicillin acylase 2 proenzyme-like [Nerophis lumbriciformis]